MIPLQQVASAFGEDSVGHLENLTYLGVTQDSRQVQSGFVYVAISGARVDGHDFLSAAFDAGAVCAIVERISPINQPQILVKDAVTFLQDWARATRAQWQDKTVIGLTGSLGKTTHKEMLLQLCANIAPCYATPGNYNNYLGLSLSILNAPEPARIIILELGISEPGEMALLANIAQPDIAYVTNIHPCHLEGLGNVETIAEEKSKIYQALTEDGLAIINNMDNHAAAFFAASTHCQQQMLCNERNSLDHQSMTIDQGGCPTFQFRLNHKDYQISLPCVGAHMAHNAFAAAAIAFHMGVPGATIVSTLNAYTGSAGRMQIRRCHQTNATIIDDCYNANPIAMQAAIQCLSSMQHQQKILVCGDMAELGGAAAYWHSQVGVWASERGIQKMFAYGKYAQQMLSAFVRDGEAYTDMYHLINAVRSELSADAAILIKGSRASQLDQCVSALIDPNVELPEELPT